MCARLPRLPPATSAWDAAPAQPPSPCLPALPALPRHAAAKQDGIGILNVTHELCGGQTHVRGNGEVGGWVAPLNPFGGGGQQQQQGGARQRRRLQEELPQEWPGT